MKVDIDELAKYVLLYENGTEKYIKAYLNSNIKSAKNGYNRTLEIIELLENLQKEIPSITGSFDVEGNVIKLYDSVIENNGELVVLYKIKLER